ncbi:MAG: metallophosphoesterase [Gemmatimonadota bacterium]|nr:metallophosphoesterase [Gemmatimonadota bacterium]
MKIGVMADTHDRLPAIEELLSKMAERGVSMVMHAGDYCSPFALAPFQTAGLPLLGVFGRNDGDQTTLEATASAGFGAEIYESPHSFEVGGHKVMLVHELGEINKRSIASHDFVIHGSSHKLEQTRRDTTLLLNPGEACGWITGSCTAMVVDLDTGEVEVITL